MMRLFGVLAAAALTAGCACGPADEGGAAPAVEKTAAETLAALEERLLADDELVFGFDITADGAVEARLAGTFDAAWPGVELEASGAFAGAPATLALEANGGRLRLESTDETTVTRPPRLREALVLGLTRMGLLHNLAVLTGGGPPDHADGGVREWVEPVDVTFAAPDDDTTRVLVFTIRVAGKDTATAHLVLDGATGLPRRREQTVEFPQGEMHVVETYRF